MKSSNHSHDALYVLGYDHALTQNLTIAKPIFGLETEFNVSDGFAAVRLYFAAALVDGKVQETEKRVLFELAQKHGLSMSEIGELWTEAQAGELESVAVPEDQATRETVFANLLKIVLADEVVSRHESVFLERVAKMLNLEPLLEAKRSLLESKLES